MFALLWGGDIEYKGTMDNHFAYSFQNNFNICTYAVIIENKQTLCNIFVLFWVTSALGIKLSCLKNWTTEKKKKTVEGGNNAPPPPPFKATLPV